MPQKIKNGTIPQDESLSNGVWLGDSLLQAIQMPAAWTAASLTFQGSADGQTYADLYDGAGNEVEVSADVDQLISLDPIVFGGLLAIKVRSGTSGTPVAQAAARVLQLIKRFDVQPLPAGSVSTAKIADSAATTAKLADDSVTTAKLDESTIQYASVALTNSQIKNLRATPVQLVAAPGAGKVLEFVSGILLLDYGGTNVFTESADNLAIRYVNGSGVIASEAIETTGFIDQAADTMTTAIAQADVIAAKSACENKALVLHNTGDGEIAGNAGNDNTMRVKVAYRVHATGW